MFFTFFCIVKPRSTKSSGVFSGSCAVLFHAVSAADSHQITVWGFENTGVWGFFFFSFYLFFFQWVYGANVWMTFRYCCSSSQQDVEWTATWCIHPSLVTGSSSDCSVTQKKLGSCSGQGLQGACITLQCPDCKVSLFAAWCMASFLLCPDVPFTVSPTRLSLLPLIWYHHVNIHPARKHQPHALYLWLIKHCCRTSEVSQEMPSTPCCCVCLP